MSEAIDRLRTLMVRDVMNRGVVTVRDDELMRDAVWKLAHHEVSAAPVVDAEGCCVGILSSTDFVQQLAARVGEADPESEAPVQSSSKTVVRDALWGDRVKSHMTTAVQSIAASAPLLDAARIMDAQHIHRLIAIDHREHPIGVISTMDVVAALLNAIDEMKLTRAEN